MVSAFLGRRSATTVSLSPSRRSGMESARNPIPGPRCPWKSSPSAVGGAAFSGAGFSLRGRPRLRLGGSVIDDYTRESLAAEVDTSLPGLRVARVLDRLGAERGLPELIVVDNGPEFAGRTMDTWAYEHGTG